MRFIRDDLVDLAALRQAIAVLREAWNGPESGLILAVGRLLALDASQRAFQGTVAAPRSEEGVSFPAE